MLKWHLLSVASKITRKMEGFDGFIYNSVMQSWFSSRGSILCCSLENGRPADHTHMAKCILRKVSSTNSEGVNQVFLYDHDGGTAIDLPEPYLSAKAAALKTGKDHRGVTDEEKPGSKESANAVSETLHAINGLFSGSRNRNLSRNCSVIMSVRETAEI